MRRNNKLHLRAILPCAIIVSLLFISIRVPLTLALTVTPSNQGSDNSDRFSLLKQLLGLKKANSARSFDPESVEWWVPKSSSQFRYPGQKNRHESNGNSNEEENWVQQQQQPMVGKATDGDETTRFLGIMQRNYAPYINDAGEKRSFVEQQPSSPFRFPGSQRRIGQEADTSDQSELYASIQRSKYSTSGNTDRRSIDNYNGDGSDDSLVYSALQRQNYLPYTKQPGYIFEMPDSEIDQLISQGYVNVQQQQMSNMMPHGERNDQTKEFLEVMAKNYAPLTNKNINNYDTNYNEQLLSGGDSSTSFQFPGTKRGLQFTNLNSNANSENNYDQSTQYLNAMRKSYSKYSNNNDQQSIGFKYPGQY